MNIPFDPEIKAIVFDAFGTLVQITERHRPYKQLIELAAKSPAHNPELCSPASIMSMNLCFSDMAKRLAPDIENALLAELSGQLEREIASIELFPEATTVLKELRDAGVRIAICSNLASPYVAAVRAILPFELDAYAWSCECGYTKPDPRIYRYICDSLGAQAPEVMMIGDSLEADYLGAKRYGMKAFHLKRRNAAERDWEIHTLLGVLAI